MDWPLTYADLEPYYDKVEYAIGVSGKAGNIAGKIDPSGNTFEGPRSREYPMPPLRHSGYTELISKAATKLDWNPYPAAAAINSVPRDGRGPCMYHGFCQPNGCPHNAKGSPNVTTIPKAIATKNLNVVTGARVTRHRGRSPGTRYRRAVHQGRHGVFPTGQRGRPERLHLRKHPAPAAVEVARFPEWPRQQLGPGGPALHERGEYRHRAIFPGKQLNRFTGMVAQSLAVDNFNADHFDHSGLGFIGGGNIQMRMEAYPIATSGVVPPGLPRWGAAYKKYLRETANSIAAGINQHDSMPYEDNFLDLDPDNRDPDGVPLLRITFDVHEQEKLRAAYRCQRRRSSSTRRLALKRS